MANQPYQVHKPTLVGGSPEAGKAKTTSLILGIIGLFILGIILGPLGIMQTNKAERLGGQATPWKILGYISTILGIIGIIVGIIQLVG